MGIWDEGKRVRWSPGSKLEPCEHDPKLRDSLLWGGSGGKPPRVWFVGVSPALRQTFLDPVGPWSLISPEGPHPAPTGSLSLERAGPESSR